MEDCKCDMRTKLVGDGCSVCNPELHKELTRRECERCGKEWEYATEQAASIDLYDACISCRRHEMTKEELDNICAEAKQRGAYS